MASTAAGESIQYGNTTIAGQATALLGNKYGDTFNIQQATFLLSTAPTTDGHGAHCKVMRQIAAAILCPQQDRSSPKPSSENESVNTDTAVLRVGRSEHGQQLQTVTRRPTPRPSLNLSGLPEHTSASSRDSMKDTNPLRSTFTDIENSPPQQFVPGLDLPVPDFPFPREKAVPQELPCRIVATWDWPVTPVRAQGCANENPKKCWHHRFCMISWQQEDAFRSCAKSVENFFKRNHPCSLTSVRYRILKQTSEPSPHTWEGQRAHAKQQQRPSEQNLESEIYTESIDIQHPQWSEGLPLSLAAQMRKDRLSALFLELVFCYTKYDPHPMNNPQQCLPKVRADLRATRIATKSGVKDVWFLPFQFLRHYFSPQLIRYIIDCEIHLNRIASCTDFFSMMRKRRTGSSTISISGGNTC